MQNNCLFHKMIKCYQMPINGMQIFEEMVNTTMEITSSTFFSVNPPTAIFLFLFMQKNDLCHSPLSWNITKILLKCFFGYFEHAWPHLPKVVTATWLVKNILGNNFKKRILPHRVCDGKSRIKKGFSFCIVFRKNKWHFTKMKNTLFWGPFCPNLGLK